MTGTALVTGVAGFVGVHVARRLLADGWRVRGVDRFDDGYARGWKERAVDSLRGHGRFTLMEMDAADAAAFTGVPPAAVLVHAAARPGVRDSVGRAARAGRANAGLTAAVLTRARVVGIRRVVHLSSSSVYGAAPTPFAESAGWLRPASPYAASKRAAERLVAVAARRGARAVCLRLFSVYGPGQRPDQAAWRFADALAAGRAADQYGDGAAVRDFTFVGDVADAVARAVHWTATGPPGVLTVNIGAGRPVRVDRFRAMLADALGRPDRARRLPPAPGDVPATAAVIATAREELGWEPRTALQDGLAAFADWFEVTHGRPTRTTARSGA